MNFNVSVALNNLSFGFVGYNLLREFYNRGLAPCVFPIGGQVDLSSFDKASADFKMWLQSCIEKSHKKYSRRNPTIKQWHLNGSEASHSDKQILISFYELDNPTEAEINIVKNQERVYFTSQYTVDLFKSRGCDNVDYLPLGFDSENFHRIEKRPYPEGIITFLVAGKVEQKRKKTLQIISALVNRYGNNPRYRIHTAIYNPFASPEQNNAWLQSCLGGRVIWNLNPQPYVKTSTGYNRVLNDADIIVDASFAEGWNIPAFSATAMGKHAVVGYANGVCSWANEENAVLLKSSGAEEAYDNIFFFKGANFNQGSFPTVSSEEIIRGCELAESRFLKNPLNKDGLELQKDFTWAKTVDRLLQDLN